MTETMTQLSLELIDANDERIGKPNHGVKKHPSGVPGLLVGQDVPCIMPHVYLPDEAFASVVLTSKEIIRFLKENPFSVLCESNTKNTALPRIGQRVPTRDRRNKIREAWADQKRTPDHKHETIEVALYGAKVDAAGIHLPLGSLALLTDAAGRTWAAIDDILENEGKTILSRKILWQINFDLSGDMNRQVMAFLAQNRDAKRISRGTTVGVETMLIDGLEKAGEFTVPANFKDKLAKTYVVRQLYEKFEITRSLTELFPWNYEGRLAKCEEFRGSGRASFIVTTIGSLADQLDNMGIKPKKLPEILDFAYRSWYKKCPTAISDSHWAAEQPNYQSKYRLHTTLGMKVITLVSLRAFKFAGMNEDVFITTCERILQKHWDHHKQTGYTNSKTKKMDIDRFWQESIYFADKSRFNSGEVNTVTLTKELSTAADEVCGKLPTANKIRPKVSNGGSD